MQHHRERVYIDVYVNVYINVYIYVYLIVYVNVYLTGLGRKHRYNIRKTYTKNVYKNVYVYGVCCEWSGDVCEGSPGIFWVYFMVYDAR